MAFKLFLHCLTRELEVGFFFLLLHAAGRPRAARGRRQLLRSVLRLIANMTFKLFLHCLVCELEVDFFALWRAAAPPLAVGGLSGEITYDHHKIQ